MRTNKLRAALETALASLPKEAPKLGEQYYSWSRWDESFEENTHDDSWFEQKYLSTGRFFHSKEQGAVAIKALTEVVSAIENACIPKELPESLKPYLPADNGKVNHAPYPYDCESFLPYTQNWFVFKGGKLERLGTNPMFNTIDRDIINDGRVFKTLEEACAYLHVEFINGHPRLCRDTKGKFILWYDKDQQVIYYADEFTSMDDLSNSDGKYLDDTIFFRASTKDALVDYVDSISSVYLSIGLCRFIGRGKINKFI